MSDLFQPFPKIARLARDCIVTEKLDGTNAAVRLIPSHAVTGDTPTDSLIGCLDGFWIYAQSRSRLITVRDDNFGFARWVSENAQELLKLGEGIHFGEWWGSGIQRGYGLPKGEKRFSLFNVSRWADEAARPACCHVVPELWRGEFCTTHIRSRMDVLGTNGSVAAPGFMKPEGIVVFHVQGNLLFKKTFDRDEAGKERGA